MSTANDNENIYDGIKLETRVLAFQRNSEMLDRMSISPRARDLMKRAMLSALYTNGEQK